MARVLPHGTRRAAAEASGRPPLPSSNAGRPPRRAAFGAPPALLPSTTPLRRSFAWIPSLQERTGPPCACARRPGGRTSMARYGDWDDRERWMGERGRERDAWRREDERRHEREGWRPLRDEAWREGEREEWRAGSRDERWEKGAPQWDRDRRWEEERYEPR